MKYTFGFIGTGNMGAALCMAAAKSNPEIQIGVADKCPDKAIALANAFPNVTSTKSANIIKSSEYVFIGVKPQMLEGFCDEVNDIMSECENRPVFVCMCAGVSIEKLSLLLNYQCPIIRIMPNMPASINEGLILYCGSKNLSEVQLEFFVKAMKGAGILDKIDEEKIDAASAVSGCGPAYVFMFIEALADGAVECGIPRDKAILYASQMIAGSAKMVLESNTHPAELKDAVCSPGGTTIAGVHALEDNGFRSAVINAVTSAYKKTLEIK